MPGLGVALCGNANGIVSVFPVDFVNGIHELPVFFPVDGVEQVALNLILAMDIPDQNASLLIEIITISFPEPTQAFYRSGYDFLKVIRGNREVYVGGQIVLGNVGTEAAGVGEYCPGQADSPVCTAKCNLHRPRGGAIYAANTEILNSNSIYLWRWADSNRRPDTAPGSFLHA